jgi:hydrogenase small subunit
MSMDRRDFIKLMGGGAVALSFPTVMIQGCKKALQNASKRTNVIWVQAQSCSGCSVSLLNTVDPDIVTLITEHISLNFHQTLSGGTGDSLMKVLKEAVEKKRKDFVLVLEGSIPTADEYYCTLGVDDNGHHQAITYWINELAKNSIAVLSVGTCAAYGGIPKANGTVTGAKDVTEYLKSQNIKKAIINIPGCPPHPDWMVGTIVYFILKGKPPKLDEFGRPVMFYGKTVHDQCENLDYYKKGVFAKEWGDKGCLYTLGCLGMDSGCNVPKIKWNGVSSCTSSGSGCLGCTEPVFPDTGSRGLYQHLHASREDLMKIENSTVREAAVKLQKNGGVING